MRYVLQLFIICVLVFACYLIFRTRTHYNCFQIYGRSPTVAYYRFDEDDALRRVYAVHQNGNDTAEWLLASGRSINDPKGVTLLDITIKRTQSARRVFMYVPNGFVGCEIDFRPFSVLVDKDDEYHDVVAVLDYPPAKECPSPVVLVQLLTLAVANLKRRLEAAKVADRNTRWYAAGNGYGSYLWSRALRSGTYVGNLQHITKAALLDGYYGPTAMNISVGNDDVRDTVPYTLHKWLLRDNGEAGVTATYPQSVSVFVGVADNYAFAHFSKNHARKAGVDVHVYTDCNAGMFTQSPDEYPSVIPLFVDLRSFFSR